MIEITTMPQRLSGTYGIIVTWDSADYLLHKIHHIQVYNAGVMSDVITDAVDSDVLDSYCEDASCPDIAFTQKGNNVDVFLSTAYTYVNTVKVEFTYRRNAQNITDPTSDCLDIPDEAKNLFKSICWKLTYEAQGIRVPFDIKSSIETEIERLHLNYHH